MGATAPRRQTPKHPPWGFSRRVFEKMSRGVSLASNNDSAATMPAPPYPGYGRLFLICNIVGPLAATRAHFGLHSNSLAQSLAVFLACVVWYYPWVFLAKLVFRLEARHRLGPGRWLRSAAALALWSVPVCAVAAPLMVGADHLLFTAMGVWPWLMPDRWEAWFFPFSSAQLCFWPTVAAGYLIRTLNELHHQQRLAARLALEKANLESSLNQARLETLQARLNPHFLFNSLQNISVLTRQDPPTASRMLTRLGDLLRSVLRLDTRPEWTVREEMDLTGSYIALEQMRFGDRLQARFEIEPEAQPARIPAFLLQPLVENAITHGLRGVLRDGQIVIGARVEAGRLRVSIADNGAGLPSEKLSDLRLGVGLGSTTERLRRLYPHTHRFELHRREEGGSEIVILLPLRLEESE